MIGIILSWLVQAFAVWVTSLILPAFRIRDGKSALVIAAIFGLLSYFLGTLFYIVFGIATLGLALLFSFVARLIINAILLKITDAITDRLTIDGFGWALVAAALMAGIGSVGEWAVKILV